MASSDDADRLDEAGFSWARAAWSMEFGGREDSLEASWELAGIEERWGDSLFFGGEPGSAAHYRAAQRALVPPGMIFSSSAESERRMEAYGRLTNKLYAIGPDGKPRPGHDGRPHPRFHPVVRRQETAPPEPPEESPAQRREAVLGARQTRTRQETGLGRLYRDSDPWHHHHLGGLWLEAARALALNHPASAHRACGWGLHYYELYNKAWSAHLPASRWDSDGHAEMVDVQNLEHSLATGRPESPLPDWVPLLFEGDWQGALAALGADAPAPALKPLAVLLADACRTAGQDAAARQLLANLP